MNHYAATHSYNLDDYRDYPYHVWVRHPSLPRARQAEATLSAKYGPRFAVVRDSHGGDEAPFAVVSTHGI
jgi:hypothetical protein